MNAKFKEVEDPHTGIGPHMFGKDDIIGEGEGLEGHRLRLMEFLASIKMILANTFVHKRPQYKITNRLDKSARTEAPFTKGRFDVIDYFMVPKRWNKNSQQIIQ